jgi:hypothetical protein
MKSFRVVFPASLIAVVVVLTLLPTALTIHAQPQAERYPAVFAKTVLYPTNAAVSDAIAVADVNHDGKPDLVVGNSDSVSILLGNGDGTFQPAVTYPGGAAANSLAVADMNGDGKLDVVAGNGTVVSVFLGNGDGTFQPAIITSVAGSALGVADVDRDGIPDVVLAASTGVAVLPGKGDGTFKPAVLTTTTTAPETLAVGDLNQDGKPDVVVVTDAGFIQGSQVDHAKIGVMFGNGDGTFQPPVVYDTQGFSPEQISISDINDDGSLDIVVTDYRAKDPYKGLVDVFFNSGNGSFYNAGEYQFRGSGLAAAAEDLNDDGTWDVVAIGPDNGAIFVDGTFKNLLASGSGVVIADVNGDGQPDIVTAGMCEPGVCSGGVAEVLLSADVPSKTTVASSSNPSQTGQSVTFTSTTTSARGPALNGVVVTFYDGSHLLGTGVTANNSGQASFTTSALKAGDHSIKADFPGCIFVKKSKGTIMQVVNP